MKQTFLIVLFLSISTFVFSQTSEDVLLDFVTQNCGPGSGCVGVPGGDTYDCSDSSSEFTNSFMDPIPSGTGIESISLTGAFACTAADITVYINGDPVGSPQSFGGDNCSWDCSAPLVVFNGSDFPNYVYGGNNTVTIRTSSTAGSTCLYYINATINYNNAVPTLGQWAMISLFLIVLIFGTVVYRKSISGNLVDSTMKHT